MPSPPAPPPPVRVVLLADHEGTLRGLIKLVPQATADTLIAAGTARLATGTDLSIALPFVPPSS
jgi:hypothetical protein